MSLKDEIKKLIKAERKKLEDNYRINVQLKKESKEHRRTRFQPMRTLLDELVASFGRNYVVTKDWDGDKAMGYEVEGYCIQVGCSYVYLIQPEKFVFDYEPIPVGDGFVVTKKNWEKEGYGETPQKHEFQTEEEVMRYLTEDIAKEVALDQHLRKLWWRNWIKGIFKFNNDT